MARAADSSVPDPPATFLSVSTFREGLCAVQVAEGKFGYVDREGKLVIDAVFEKVADFAQGRAIVQRGTQLQIIERDGRPVADIDTPKIIGVYIALSAFTYRWVETPGREWTRKWLARPAGEEPQGAAPTR